MARSSHMALPNSRWDFWVARRGFVDVGKHHKYLLVHPSCHHIPMCDKESVISFPRGTIQKSDPVTAWNAKILDLWVIHRSSSLGPYVYVNPLDSNVCMNQKDTRLPLPENTQYIIAELALQSTPSFWMGEEWKAHSRHWSKANWESCGWMLWAPPPT